MTVEKKGDKFTVSCCDEDTKHPDDFKTQLQAISYSKEFLHCRYLFDQAKAKAKARRSKSSVKHAEELKTDVTATLEDTQDAIENKVEEKAKKGKEITKAEQKETVATIENIVATIQAGIKKDTDRT